MGHVHGEDFKLEAVHFGNLNQRDIRMIGDQAENEGLMGVQLRAWWQTLFAGYCLASLAIAAIPRPNRRDPNLETSGRFSRRHAIFDRCNHPLTQIGTQALCHHILPTNQQNNESDLVYRVIPITDSALIKDALVNGDEGVGRFAAAIYQVEPGAVAGTLLGIGQEASKRCLVQIRGLASGVYRVLVPHGTRYHEFTLCKQSGGAQKSC